VDRLIGHKTFVVTGGLGFIGSHFVERLLSAGHCVINIDCVTYAANEHLKFVGDYRFIRADIKDIDDIPFCDIIVNFAAESHVDNSIVNASNFIDTNIMGVHNLLEILRRHKVKNLQSSWGYRSPLFVQISTDEVFGDILSGFYSENDRHMPSNPYSASKSCAEMLLVAWARTYDLPYMITRTTNNYGQRQHSEKLIPAAITNLLQGYKVIVHGDGRYIRNWIHVEDNVDAIIKVISQGDVNTSYHVSSDEEYSVRDIVTMVATKLGFKYEDVIDTSTDRNGCDERYALDCQRTKLLGWTHQRHLSDELDMLIQYYRSV
jgi:dTDP-glucose 4,6-dehydratase